MAGGGDSWMVVKAAYATMGVAGRVALVAGAACVAITGAALFNFGRSVIGPGVSAAAVADNPKDLTAAHDATFERYLAQWNGRSLIIKPGAPRIAEAPPPEPPSGPPPPPPPPSSYGGPAIIAMVMDTVWFDDGKKMSVGEEAKDDIEVTQVLAPWEAVVKWKGVQFTVPLFQRDKLVQKPEEKPAEASPDAKPTEQAGPPDPGSTGDTSGTPKPEVSKTDPAKLAEGPPPKPEKPPEPKQDAAPSTPDQAAPAPPARGTQPKETERPPPGGDGGWR